MTTIEELAQRLDRLESIEAIRALKHKYAAACDDDYNPTAVSELFVEDARWDAGPEVGQATGRAEIEAFFSTLPAPTPFAAHFMLNAEIEVEGDRASANWWLLMPNVRVLDGEETAHWHVADYHDTYVRIDGKWYFETLRVTGRFFAPWNTDWAGQWRQSVAEVEI